MLEMRDCHHEAPEAFVSFRNGLYLRTDLPSADILYACDGERERRGG
jgi:hypothetical protein